MEGEARLFRRAEPWTPASTDIQAVEGRYQSEDVDRVFEVLPGTNGIRLRLEGSPDKAIDLEPVTRDTYMQRLMIVRFRRDASGKVTGLEYGNPVVRNLPFTRRKDATP
jgi:hypothetical protein